MATRSFSTFVNNEIWAFAPGSDVLFFDSALISAAEVSLSWNGSSITLTASGKTITLSGATIEQVTTSNITFADSSRLQVGDNLVSTMFDVNGNIITGTTGDDQLIGLGGIDQIDGQGGNDVLNGGDGQDLFTARTAGNASIHGGDGADFVFYTNVAAVNANLQTGTAIKSGGGTDTLTSIENVDGTAGADTLTGNSSNNILNGFGG